MNRVMECCKDSSFKVFLAIVVTAILSTDAFGTKYLSRHQDVYSSFVQPTYFADGYEWKFFGYEDGTAELRDYFPGYDQYDGYLSSRPATIPAPTGAMTIPAAVNSVIGEIPVARIGIGAFAKCKNLTHVTMQEGVTSIEDGAFYGCNNLVQVMIPDSVEMLTATPPTPWQDRPSFWHGSGPNEMQYYGSFEGCNESLYDTTSFPGLKLVDGWVVGYADSLSDIVVFDGRIRGIGSGAFMCCSNMSQVKVSGNIKNIPDAAFVKCNRLSSVTIDSGVTSIGTYAFADCPNLASVSIPSTVTSIGAAAFNWCAPSLFVTNNAACLGMKLVDNWAIGWLKSIPSIPDFGNLSGIADGAFRNCGNLTRVTIPGNMKKIGRETFADCTNLTHVTIQDGVTSIGKGAFSNCPNLVQVSIPGSVTEIGENAFMGCGSLSTIVMGDGVKDIRSDAFRNCTNLVNVGMGYGVETIGDRAFSNCVKLARAPIGNCVKWIMDDAFADCRSLQNVAIPKSLIFIGDNVFLGCSVLSDVAFSDGTKFMGANVFSGCASLTELTIPNSVTNLEEGLLAGCCNIRRVSLPFLYGGRESRDSETKYVTSYFAKNFGLAADNDNKDLYVNIKLRSSGSRHNADHYTNFRADIPKSLTEVTISDAPQIPIGVIATGGAFASCDNLKRIVIGSTTTKLSFRTTECLSLTEIVIDAANPVYASVDGVLYDKAVKNLLYCPKGREKALVIPDSVTNIAQGAVSYCDKLTQVALGRGMAHIGDSTFANCASLTSVTIPDSVTSIGNSVFIDCTSLPKIELPGGVTNVGYGAFENCTSLREVTGGNVKDISFSMFAGCTSLPAIPFSASVTNIAYGAFYNCTGLEGVTIPGNVMHIGDSAFRNCTGLVSVTFNGNAPTIGSNAFRSVADGCVVYVRRSSTGWGVDIPGTWNGLRIEYGDGDEPPAPVTYTVSFVANGGTGTMAAQTFTEGEEQALTQNAFTHEGHTFDGWATSPDGNVVYADGQRITAPSDMTLYAHWTATQQPDPPPEPGPDPEPTDIEVPVGYSTYSDGVYTWVWQLENDGVCLAGFYDGKCEDWVRGVYPEPSGRLVIPATVNGLPVVALDAGLCEGCGGITSVEIPNTVERIGRRVFCETGIKSVQLPDSVRELGDYVFLDTPLESVNVPRNLGHVGGDVFYGTPWLAAQGEFAFFGEGNLILWQGSGAQVVIPDTVRVICPLAFYGCEIESASIPASVEMIDESAFTWCESLKTVSLQDGVTSIGNCAFYGCSGLAGVTFEGNAPILGASVFDGVNDVCVVHVRRSSTGWGVDIPGTWNGLRIEYIDGDEPEPEPEPGVPIFTIVDGVLTAVDLNGATEVTIPDGVMRIGDMAFYGCDGLVRVTIPAGVELGYGVFAGCMDLKTAVFSDGVEDIGDETFMDCSSLAQVTLPATCKTIGRLAFCGSGLANVTIPNGVIYIGMFAFESCKISHVTIPGSVTRLGGNAFIECENLSTVEFLGAPPQVVEGMNAYSVNSPSGLDVGSCNGVYPAAHAAAWNAVIDKDGRWHGLKMRPDDDTTIVFDVQQEYEAEPDGTFSLEMSKLVVSASTPKLTVKGLPAGLKFDAKTGVISGKATKPGKYTVTVGATNATVKKPVTATFDLVVPNLTSEVLPGLKAATDAYGVVMCGVSLDAGLIDCAPENGWAMKVSGLPSGLKYDAKTGKITGVPTKAGTFTVTFTASKKGVKAKETATITLKTEALPTWATGTFAGSVKSKMERGKFEEYGYATMTVAANGKLSGKITIAGTKWTFSAASFSRVEGGGELNGRVEHVERAEGDFVIEAVAKAGKATMPVVLRVGSGRAGRWILPNAVVEGTFGEGEMRLWRNVWKDKATATEAKATIEEFMGVYAVSMEDGGYLSLTVGKDGNVKASGKLADGTSVSATSPLMYDEDAEWFAMVYAAPSAYKGGSFAAAVGFAAEDGAAVSSEPPCRLAPVMFAAQWINRNPQATGVYGEGFGREVEFTGAFYDKAKKLNERYNALRFSAEQPTLDGVEPQNSGEVEIAIDAKGKPVIDKASGLTLSFTQVTGIFKGGYTFVFDAKTKKKVSFEGILVPGADSLRGFYLWDASSSYVDPKTGKQKTYKYKESYGVSLTP